MNNRLKRIAFITSAVFLCSAMGPYLSAIYKGQEPADTKPVTKKAVHAEIVAAEQTAPVIERLTYACEENNQKEINSVCDTIVAEMDAAKREVAAYGIDIDEWASDEIKARQEKYENELNIKYAETSKAVEELRNGIDTEKNLGIISDNIIESKEHHYSDATPNIEEVSKELGSVEDDHITKSADINSPAPSDSDLRYEGGSEFPEPIQLIADSFDDANSIYLYVKNNIKYEPYWGSKKEALITLAQQGGNDLDQASLLIALLRAKGIPARYVTGTSRITPQQALEITGATDETAAGRIIAGGFRNAKRILDNGTVIGYMMTRTWVEAYIPYTDYRGAGNKSGEGVWVQLDPSFKTLDSHVKNISADYNSDMLDIISNTQKYYEANSEAEAPAFDKSADIPCYFRSIVKTEDKYIPSSLPYILVGVDSRYSVMRDSDKDKISIGIDGETIVTKPVSQLYGKPVTISYEPAHSEDASVMDRYDNLTEVPAYLVNVKPVVTIGSDKYKITDSDISWLFETQLGTDHQMFVRISTNGSSNILVDNIMSGSMYSLNLDLQSITNDDIMACRNNMKNAEANYSPKNMCTPEELGAFLSFAGKYYFSLCDAQSAAYSTISNIDKTRRLGVAITGYRFAKSASFGMVRNLDYGSFYIDVAYNSALTISLDGDKRKENEFILGLGTLESYYEGYLWEQLIDPEETCISTVSVTSIAAKQGISPVYITKDNADKKLESCNVTKDVKEEVMNFVNRGLMVELVPETLTIGDWTGTAYTAIDMSTGSASYMISGGTAGGSSMDFEGLFNLNNKLASLNFVFAEISMVQGYNTFIAGEMSYDGMKVAQGANSMINAATALGGAMTMRYDNYDYIFKYAEEGETEEVMNEYIDFTLKNLLNTIVTASTMILSSIAQVAGGLAEFLPNTFTNHFGHDFLKGFSDALGNGTDAFSALYDVVTTAIDEAHNMDESEGNDYDGPDKWAMLTVLTDLVAQVLSGGD